jgi:hypothetical protein
VRLAAVLVEGTGTIDTRSGLDSDGVKRSPDGPIEIQAFVQDAFAGTAAGAVRGNPVAAALPSNLPTIRIVQVITGISDFCGFECSNTGSLVTPDVNLAESDTPVDLLVSVNTDGVPNGDSTAYGTATPATLRFRAVGSNGSVVEADALVFQCDCSTGDPRGEASATLVGLNPGATYQIVVTPRDGAYPLARAPQAAPMRGTVPVTGLRDASADAELAARWARALGADPRTLEAQVARMTVQVGQGSE